MRKFIAAALAVVMLVFPSAAYANDTATMDVSITLTEDDVTPLDTEPIGPDFIVNIPASLPLDDTGQGNVELTWDNYELEAPDMVRVYIDGAKTFTDETFYLLSGDGGTDARRLICAIERYHPGSAYSQTTTGPEDIEIAQFYADSDSEFAGMLGGLRFYLMGNNLYEKEAGTYTGTVHFKIEVEH